MNIHPVSKILVPVIVLIVLAASTVFSQGLNSVLGIGRIESYILTVVILLLLLFGSVIRRTLFGE